MLTETWSSSQLSLNNYYAVNCVATRVSNIGRPSGGVSVFYNHRLGDMKTLIAEDDCVVIEGSRINVIALYVRPAPVEGTGELVEKLTTCIQRLDWYRPTIIAGDLNARLDKPTDNRTIALIDILADLGFWIATDPTVATFEGAMGSSVIDIFATNLVQSAVHYLGRDHQLIGGATLTAHVPVGLDVSVDVQIARQKSRVALSKYLDSQRLSTIINTVFPCPERPLIEEYNELLTGLLLSCVPPQHARRGTPWWTPQCSSAKAIQFQARDLARMRPEMCSLYAASKALYRRTLKEAKLQYEIRKEDKLLSKAHEQPHVWLKTTKQLRAPCPVDRGTLRAHFQNILGDKDTIPREPPTYTSVWSEEDTQWREYLGREFDIQEVTEAIHSLRKNKSPGPDNIRNEHIQEAMVLAPCWTTLFNECMRRGKIPSSWRQCLLTLISKGKGTPTDPASWRGIAKKSCIYKLLASLLVRRLTPYIAHKDALPDEQHGFRPHRSTLSACTTLLKDIDSTLSRKGQFLYSVFVDFRAAFDSGSRCIVLNKFAELGVPAPIVGLLQDVLQTNQVVIDDGVTEHPPLVQTNGFTQGDNLSPLMFTLLIADLPPKIKKRHPTVDIIMYADDLVIYSRSRFHLQQALATLSSYIADVGLEINAQKTEAMKFRRGGRIAEGDTLRLNGHVLSYVNRFTYLGVTLTPSGKTFGVHIEQRVAKALVAATMIAQPQKLSLSTALALFNMKIAPTASYGIELLWEKLSTAHLALLDSTKPAFLKRVLGLHCSTRNRLVYLLTGTPLFVEQLKSQFKFPETPAYREFIRLYDEKMADVDPDFYNTRAMTNTEWKGVCRNTRHTVVRYAVHGFHHAICRTEGYHDLSDLCICKYCGLSCSRYHAGQCTKMTSMTSLNMIS